MSIFKPFKVLSGTEVSSKFNSFWNVQEFDTDPYWASGTSPKAYSWVVEFDISAQSHSSPTTREPYLYNGLDIFSGMWVTDADGVALRVTHVLKKSVSSVTVIIEDEFRVNTFKDTSGSGAGFFRAGGPRIFFELDDQGMPILDPIPSRFNRSNAFAALSARFQKWNINRRYPISILGHSIKVGDILVANQVTHKFEALNEDNNNMPVVGTVLETYPTRVYVSPLNRVIRNFSPDISGEIGDFIYYDSTTNKYTNTKTNNRVYLKLTDNLPTYVLSPNEFTQTSGNEVISINLENINITGTSAADLVNDINAKTISHKVNGSVIVGATVAQTATYQLAYGVVGVILPGSFSINGVTVNFTTDTSGSQTLGAGLADINDVVYDINNANVPNITASVDGGRIVLSNTSGGDIILANISNDANATPIAGNWSCTGLPMETTAVDNKSYIRLEREDGGPIDIKDVTGTLISDLGLFSVQNGMVPDVMLVENWDRKSNNYVVQTPAERDALIALLKGDECFVVDTGNGEWSKWLYDGVKWTLIATEDSARTDADVLTIEIDHTATGGVVVGTVSNHSRVTDVTIEVLESFDGEASLSVGDAGDFSRLISDDIVDLETVGTYTNTPSYVYEPGGDTDIVVYCNFTGSTTGRVKVIVSYS